MSLERSVGTNGLLQGSAAQGKTVTGKVAGLSVLYYDAYQIAVKNGYDGTVEEWLASLKGEQGEQGVSVESASIDPSNNHLVLNLSNVTVVDAGELPKGQKGDTGATGAQGEKGDKGDKGDTGEAGAAGADGEDGVSPVVTVTEIAGGHRVAITDAEGEKSFDVMDGAGGTGGGGEGLTETEKTLILTLFRNAVYTANMRATLNELSALWGGGTGGGITVTDDGAGNVTVSGLSVTDDGAGNVVATGATVTDDGNGNVTLT